MSCRIQRNDDLTNVTSIFIAKISTLALFTSKKKLLQLNEVDSIGLPLEIQSSLFVLEVASKSYCKSL